MLLLKVLAVAATAAAICEDNVDFLDEMGNPCADYANTHSCLDAAGLSDFGRAQVLANCGASCESCVKANDVCEIGTGGDRFEPTMRVESFDLFEQPFLNAPCEWVDTPSGLRQTSFAWGNIPGENVVLGCVAALKSVVYEDLILEIDAWHDDDDAVGIIFGMDPNDPTSLYKVFMMNDDWLNDPTDQVQGPFLKITRTNGKACNGTMTPETDCEDTIAFVSREDSQSAADYPRGLLRSMDWVPEPYSPTYDDYKFKNADGRPVRLTLIVSLGEVRAYFTSRNNAVVGVWADLPADYAGGRIGLFTSSHQADFRAMRLVDLSAAATPMTGLCAQPGAVCDTTLGLCLGGPTPNPTATPSFSPTFLENCQEPTRHAAADVCPSPVGGAATQYDVTDLNAWELIQQAPVSEDCAWSADATGLSQTSNAWGNYPNDNSLIGCVAMIPDSFTDFIAEYEAEHFDNDAWGFVFGYKGELDHFVAHSMNDRWPGTPTDGIPGPHTKLRKTTGLPCLAEMNETSACYETLGYTDGSGYSDYGSDRVDGPRSKEYEYTHSYAASTAWQPHKATLIVQNGEARMVYPSPSSEVDTAINNVRQSNRFQAALSFDLKGYAGGRVGVWMYGHQMTVTSFKVTDISDPADMPTTYCGGAAGAFCDAGVTGLCLAVAASGVCEKAVGGTKFDVTNLDTFTYVADDSVSGCLWTYGAHGYLSHASSANRDQGTALGCNAMAPGTFVDFVAEMAVDHLDDDALGFTFGWQGQDDHFRVHKVNDDQPHWNTPSDLVPTPAFKVRRRIPGTSCDGRTTVDNACYETIAFVDGAGSFYGSMPEGAVAPSGECGYSNVYLQYNQDAITKMYLIVKDRQLRATYESPLSRRQVTVMHFDLGKFNYTGGAVGLFVSSHLAEFYAFSIASLSAAGAVAEFCDGDPCSERTGRCLGSPTMTPTFHPTAVPTTFPTPNVAANEFCQGPMSATATTVVDTSNLSLFLLVDHPLLADACDWTADASGLSQNSNAWGNSPGDNTLMGCMAMFQAQPYTDFIAEIDVTHIDNDGWGVVFGFNAVDDHYLGIAMNDRWPSPAADDISGPFLKLKKHNGKEALPVMDASNTCFDTLAHLDSNGFNKDAMQGGTGVGLPKEYAATYPYRRGATFEDTTAVLIVKDQEARFHMKTPDFDLGTETNSLRQSQTMTAVWTFDLAGYAGGLVGVFTYNHRATFSNWKITDLTDSSAITAYCDGDPNLTCDNARGAASTGLCHSIPAPDVCEGPVGDSVITIDTSGVLNDVVDFDYFTDPMTGYTHGTCDWSVSGQNGHLYQSSNSFTAGRGVVLGCHAVLRNVTMTDFVLQVDIENDDDDAVGLTFGWQSLDDHFKLYKMNDDWPNPAADSVPGPVLKVQRKNPLIACDEGDFRFNSSYSCYDTLAYVDERGVGHGAQPSGAVVPFEYSRVYIPFVVGDVKRLVLIIRNNALRVMYEDAAFDTAVGAFVFDLAPYAYSGGRLGLHTAGHQAEFSNFLVAPLSGPDAVTTFCNGGICDARLGLCTSTPTQHPTSKASTIPLADVCPGPVGGNTVAVSTLDLSNFNFIDQEPLSEPCAWQTDSQTGLRQTANAWGSYPGASTVLGCIALIGTETYTDFMLEVTASHGNGVGGDDAWGVVWGYDGKGVVPEHYMALATNDKWPDPAMDGVRGPFAKMKRTNGKQCVGGVMSASANNTCYDTLSYNDYLGRFVIDGETAYDVAGEWHARYPFKVGEAWPERKLTLIVKDGVARFQLLGQDKSVDTPIFGYRQPSRYVGTWTALGSDYVGGLVGLFVNHDATFLDITLTDLSDDATLPTAYCDGTATCANGACVTVAAADVCPDPVGAMSINVSDMSAFDFVDDAPIVSPCQWSVENLGRGAFLFQSSDTYGPGPGWSGAEALGCNALVKDASYVDFILEADIVSFDNDGVGFVFGYRSELEHFKVFKRIDSWPSPVDYVEPGHLKVVRRRPDRACTADMNYTTSCYETVAFTDQKGVFHSGFPENAVTPWQYAERFYDYAIGSGVDTSPTQATLIVKSGQLRTFFTSPEAPAKKIAVMAFDLPTYDGGRLGFHMFSHKVHAAAAQFLNARVIALDGATDFCAQGGTCSAVTGLCK